jgi:two-component sensor histidine kinase
MFKRFLVPVTSEAIAASHRGQGLPETTFHPGIASIIDPSRASGTRGDTPLPPTDEDRLRRAVEACGVALWEWRFAGELCLLTPGSRELVGWSGTYPVSPGRFLSLVHRDDLLGLKEAVEAAFRYDDVFEHEFRIRKANSEDVGWIAVKARVVERGASGEALVMAGSAADVTTVRRDREARDLTSQELAHRMKNVLSVVGSLVALSGEHRPEARNFVTAFQARLGSLAATHELLVQTEWRPIVLGRLVEKVLSPLGALDRVTMVGNQAFLLGSHDAQTLALVLHELATNAIKYGALSNGYGRVALAIEVKWDRVREEQPLLVLRWEETGGPAVTAPTAKGFGLTLLERLTRRHDQVDQVLEWRASGLYCCVSLRVVPVRTTL